MNDSIVFGCAQGWEDSLIAELPKAAAQCLAPGLVLAHKINSSSWDNLIFAREWMPEAQLIQADSANKLASACVDLWTPKLRQGLPWTWRWQTPDSWEEKADYYKNLASRVRLIQRIFQEQMRSFFPGLWKKHLGAEKLSNDKSQNAMHSGYLSDCIIVAQGVLIDKDKAWVSISTSKPQNTHKPPFFKPLWQQIHADQQAPCRSYYKLEEVWLELGQAPTEQDTCVDLGAAPGGWTWSALKRGSKVIAVDAAALAPHIQKHRNCTHCIENGYTFTPQQPADWLLCDIIARPLASLGILERWLAQGLCHNFVVAIKFRGKDPSSLLPKIAEVLKPYQHLNIRVRHLYYNHNEITIFSNAQSSNAKISV